MSTLIHYIMSFIMYTIGTGLSPETTSCSVELSSPQEKVAITPSLEQLQLHLGATLIPEKKSHEN